MVLKSSSRRYIALKRARVTLPHLISSHLTSINHHIIYLDDPRPNMSSKEPTSNPPEALLSTIHRIISPLTTRLLALCTDLLSITALLAKCFWIFLAPWWRFTVALLFALVVVHGVNALSLSLMWVCARWAYERVVDLLLGEYEEVAVWAVGGEREGGEEEGEVR